MIDNRKTRNITLIPTTFRRTSIINKYCKDLNVKIIFSLFKVSTIFSPTDFVPDSLKSRVVYQFTCASRGARSDW